MAWGLKVVHKFVVVREFIDLFFQIFLHRTDAPPKKKKICQRRIRITNHFGESVEF